MSVAGKYPPNKMIPKGAMQPWPKWMVDYYGNFLTLSQEQRKVLKKAHNKRARRWRKDVSVFE